MTLPLPVRPPSWAYVQDFSVAYETTPFCNEIYGVAAVNLKIRTIRATAHQVFGAFYQNSGETFVFVRLYEDRPKIWIVVDVVDGLIGILPDFLLCGSRAAGGHLALGQLGVLVVRGGVVLAHNLREDDQMLTVKVASRQLAVNSIESVLIFLGRLEHIDFLAFRMDIEKLVTSGRKRGGDYCRIH